MKIDQNLKKKIILAVLLLVVIGAGWWGSKALSDKGPGEGFASGNGRIEATEIDISTRTAGRVIAINADEGSFVKAGEPLAQMQLDILQPQRDEAFAAQKQAEQQVAEAEAQIAARQSDAVASWATVKQRQAELNNAVRRLKRSQILSKEGAASIQELDDDQAGKLSAEAVLAATTAQAKASDTAIKAAEAQRDGALAAVTANQATVARLDAEIRDTRLVSPKDGRVQYKVAEVGEVLAAGGRVLNLVDLSDVYMTFFLPSKLAGRVALGSQARIVLDAAPNQPIPASISFVSATAQFTPKNVETAVEREKLMFRVKAQIPPKLLLEHLEQVKTGLPGVAWVRLDKNQPWPESLRSPFGD